MGLGSIILGVFAMLCMFAGVLTTAIPFLGTMLSFLAPLLALAGIVLGGVGMSQAREQDEKDALAIAGVVVSSIAFFPAMLVALTCGVCNTLCTGAMLSPHPSGQGSAPFWTRDAGAGSSPFDLLFPDAGAPAGALPPAPFPPPPIAVPDPSAADPSAVDPSAADPGAADPSAADPSAADPSAADPSAAPPSHPHQPSGAHTPGTPPALPPPPLPAGPTAP